MKLICFFVWSIQRIITLALLKISNDSILSRQIQLYIYEMFNVSSCTLKGVFYCMCEVSVCLKNTGKAKEINLKSLINEVVNYGIKELTVLSAVQI